MSQTQCSVCGNKVSAEKNMIAEHKDRRGNICYGSFTPVQNFDPFYVKRTAPIGGLSGGFPAGSLEAYANENPPYYQFGGPGSSHYADEPHEVMDDDQFMNELRNIN